MKRWMMAILLIAGTGLMQGQSADTSRLRYRGFDPAASAATAQRVDRFVDKDGDGICDERASGLGLRRRGQGMKKNAIDATGVPERGHGRQLQKGRRP